MFFDVTWFGYGAGVVMAFWVAGMIVASFFSSVSSIR